MVRLSERFFAIHLSLVQSFMAANSPSFGCKSGVDDIEAGESKDCILETPTQESQKNKLSCGLPDALETPHINTNSTLEMKTSPLPQQPDNTGEVSGTQGHPDATAPPEYHRRSYPQGAIRVRPHQLRPSNPSSLPVGLSNIHTESTSAKSLTTCDEDKDISLKI